MTLRSIGRAEQSDLKVVRGDANRCDYRDCKSLSTSALDGALNLDLASEASPIIRSICKSCALYRLWASDLTHNLLLRLFRSRTGKGRARTVTDLIE